MPQGLVVDQEFKSLCPALTPDEYNRLQASIEAEGCVDAITVWGKIIVDGHNRYEICRALGRGFKVRTVTFASRDAAKAWIIDHQLGRRNLTTGQRAMLAAQIPTKPEGQPKNSVALPSTPDVAARAGISTKTLTDAKVVLDKGTPAQKAAVVDGKAAVSTVANAIRHPEPKAAETPPAVRDEEGHPLPADKPKIAAVFARRDELTKIMGELSRIKGQVLAAAEKDPLYARLNTSEFQTAMDRARAAMKFTAPHSLCPYCAGDGCKACRKAGWVTKEVWSMAPAEMKEAMAK